jgi:hypothetical protein
MLVTLPFPIKQQQKKKKKKKKNKIDTNKIYGFNDNVNFNRIWSSITFSNLWSHHCRGTKKNSHRNFFPWYK